VRSVLVGIATFALLGMAAACNDSSSSERVPRSRTNIAAADCPTTPVHFTPRRGTEPSLRGLPWVAAAPVSSDIVGHLFYYGVPGVPWGKRHAAGLRIYPHGRVPTSAGAGTKILWRDYSNRSRGPLIVRGRRLDAPGRFHQAFAMLGPSVIDVPSSGCWHLSLHTGTTTAAVTVIAVGETNDGGR
jgi:hypothetical protein